jgi:hypothetical protein
VFFINLIASTLVYVLWTMNFVTREFISSFRRFHCNSMYKLIKIPCKLMDVIQIIKASRIYSLYLSKKN